MNRKVCGIYQVYLNRNSSLHNSSSIYLLYTREHSLRKAKNITNERLLDSQFLDFKALSPQSAQPFHTIPHTHASAASVLLSTVTISHLYLQTTISYPWPHLRCFTSASFSTSMRLSIHWSIFTFSLFTSFLPCLCLLCRASIPHLSF